MLYSNIAKKDKKPKGQHLLVLKYLHMFKSKFTAI